MMLKLYLKTSRQNWMFCVMNKQASLAEWKHLHGHGGNKSVSSIAPTLHPASALAPQWVVINLNTLTLHHSPSKHINTHFEGLN